MLDPRALRFTASSRLGLLVSAVALLAARGAAYAATTSCVSRTGADGCAVSIQAAIDAVTQPNSTIWIRPGTYRASCTGPACSVASIRGDAPNGAALAGLTLRCGHGQGRSRPVHLDATNLDHAVYVSKVDGVTVEGCVAEHARREGILVENSNGVRLSRNEVANNDEAMAETVGTGTPPCPTFLAPHTPGTDVIACCPDAFSGGPGGFPFDNDDCGEGIHLRSVTSSVVQGNEVHDNIGGILVTDETGPASGNVIANNVSSHNLKFGGDCGVTLASHLACAAGSDDATGCTLAPPVNGVFQGHGVDHNTAIGNVLRHNGASGAGMFANPGIPPGAATKAFANVVRDNVVQDNGQPGIAIHVHAANGNADDNVIIGNAVSGNGGDEEAEGASPPGIGIEIFSNAAGVSPAFAPAAPIVDTTVEGNVVFDEPVDVWVGDTRTNVHASLNDLLGANAIGVENAGSGTVFATENWWGCVTGPNTPGCSATSGDVVTVPFLTHPVTSGPGHR
jgi:parallel beta-helix repeat protein